ncbi:hypothetical protein COB28_00480 [Candidatus Dependentiae bacterium]|nr:MAG: hypothetical protein COB28_00480 [Candidatus Dependentiae bacterium]
MRRINIFFIILYHCLTMTAVASEYSDDSAMIHEILTMNDQNCIEQIFDNITLNEKNSDGETFFYQMIRIITHGGFDASSERTLYLINACFNKGADPNVLNHNYHQPGQQEEHTILHFLTINNNPKTNRLLPIINIFLQRGANPDATDSNGKKPINLIKDKNCELYQILLQAGHKNIKLAKR